MSTLIFILPDRKTAWSQSVPGVPTLALARRVRRGEWRLPAAWQQCLEREHGITGGLELELRVHSGCVVLIGHRPGERVTVSQAGLVLRLSRGSSRVLRERLDGATIKAIDHRRKQRRAWADRLIESLLRRAGRAARKRGR